MNQERKEIIIKEIKYWKQTRLLPEQYCNYLLTLYTEGEEEQLTTNNKRSSVNIKSMITFFIVQFLLLLSVVVIYFTDFPFLLQMAFGIFCVFLISYIARKTTKYLSQLAHLYLLISAIILLLVIVQSIDQVLPSHRLAMSLVVLLNCIVWLFIGLKFKLKYFMIGGSVGVLLIIIFFLFY
ncbi:hypothetical protein [Alkalihalobacillus sp. BA299]|uniref:hypothetical protein n=1 Tax=Alkalihalobacillus sp. BA299 TaxID=2815938 RepID=UPI001ADB6D6C|nr:hypothetical protein [Alkalihalobacillus sp. BA299]